MLSLPAAPRHRLSAPHTVPLGNSLSKSLERSVLPCTLEETPSQAETAWPASAVSLAPAKPMVMWERQGGEERAESFQHVHPAHCPSLRLLQVLLKAELCAVPPGRRHSTEQRLRLFSQPHISFYATGVAVSGKP